MHPPSSGALKECQTTKPRQTVERSAANTLTDGRWSPQFFRLNRLRRRGGRDNRFTERHGMSVYRSLAHIQHLYRWVYEFEAMEISPDG